MISCSDEIGKTTPGVMYTVETHEKALEAELRAEARLDAADPRVVTEYEASAWCELWGVWYVGPLQRVKKRRAGAEIGGNDAHSVRLRKRRRGADMLEEPDGVKVKSADSE